MNHHIIFCLGIVVGIAFLACSLWLCDLGKEYILNKSKSTDGSLEADSAEYLAKAGM